MQVTNRIKAQKEWNRTMGCGEYKCWKCGRYYYRRKDAELCCAPIIILEVENDQRR